jgi:phosphate transport system protein
MGNSPAEGVLEQIRRMGELVDEAVDKAVRSLKDRQEDEARQVIEGDRVFDEMELAIERECLRLLAERPTNPTELRAISTAFKVSTDLERMADHAADIAKATLRLGREPLIKPLLDIPRMAHLARTLLRQALQAYEDRDAEAAMAAARLDDDVDSMYGQVFRELLAQMIEDPSTIRQATYLLFVASHLERVADHATNLAEWTVYMVTGERRDLND